MLVVLATGEAALRVFGFSPEKFRSPARLVAAQGRLRLDCYPTNPRGYFEVDLRDPAIRARYPVDPIQLEVVAGRTPWALESRYNDAGFRGGELPPRRPGVRRVIVLGDSFTEGQGVKEEDAYPRVLEKILGGGPGGFEVLNCGRRGADFPGLFKLFEEVSRYEPDVVVYGMVLNDADQSEAFRARQTYVNDFIVDRGRMLFGGLPTPGPGRYQPPPPREMGRLDSRLAAWIRDRVGAARTSRATTRWYLDMYAEPNREGWERTQGYIKEMNRRLSRRGARLLVTSWPLLVDMEGDDRFAPALSAIAAFCKDAGIPWHDLRPALRGRPASSLWVHPVDMHPNETAHRLAAESLAPVVRTLAASTRPGVNHPTPDPTGVR